MRNLTFVVNPIAGLGGRVGLKGTDGCVELALQKGAHPRAGARAELAVRSFLEQVGPSRVKGVHWLTCAGTMGEDVLRGCGVERLTVVHTPPEPLSTTARDTQMCVTASLDAGSELVVFCGGDGTARDVAGAVGERRVPIVGIPAGVKMHSGVFAVDPVSAGSLLAGFLEGRCSLEERELIDLDEEAYRRGEWRFRMCGSALTPAERGYMQAAKTVYEESGEDVVSSIAEHVRELMHEQPERVWVFGAGSTVARIAERLGLKATLLGIDVYRGTAVEALDVDERGLLESLKGGVSASLLLCPVGGQGFILGRGNLQVSPEVIRRIGPENVLVVATPRKLLDTPLLRVDTGDPDLDREFRGYIYVVTGYRTRRLVRVG